MRNFLYIAVFAWLMFSPGFALADKAYITSKDLLLACPPNGDKVACQWYIGGVIDYHNIVNTVKNTPTLKFCIPDGVSLAKVADQVLYYLAQSPQHDSFIASPAVMLALNRAYPCS